MSKKKTWLLLILVILLITGGWLTKGRKKEKIEQVEKVEQVKQVKEKTDEARLILNFGEREISTYSAKIDQGKTVLDILSQIAQENDFTLETKESDFGVLVEEIGDLKNSADRFWLYYVNDEMAEVAANQYELKPGDVVEWKYEKFKN